MFHLALTIINLSEVLSKTPTCNSWKDRGREGQADKTKNHQIINRSRHRLSNQGTFVALPLK